MRIAALAGAFALLGWTIFAAEVMPPKPQRHFNDSANVISAEVEQRLNRRLEDLEKTNSTQVVVAIFKKMQSDSSIEDYTQRVAQHWGVGTKEKNNGAVLFVFTEDRKMFLQVGYGLEGALPDATAKSITEFRIKPHFKRGDYDRGMIAGVDSILQAVRGEYQAAGIEGVTRRVHTVMTWVPIIAVLLIFFAIASTRRRRGWVYGRTGRHGWGGPVIWTGGGGGWGTGGGGGGWGGGFSGGGGSFGGGGAGSSW